MKAVYHKSGTIKEFIMHIPDKTVICARCYNVYNLKDAILIKPDNLRIKEPACSNCKCKIYFS